MNERMHMKLSPEEKEKARKQRQQAITCSHEDPPKIGAGRKNERYEKAANRRAADIYVQNF